MTDEQNQLSSTLHRLVDDHPVAVPGLVEPARRRLRRRRVAVGGAAVAVVTGALVVSLVAYGAPRQAVMASSPTVAGPSATSAPASTAAPSLTDETIVARCASQMAKYAALPQFGPTTKTWHVAHTTRTYTVGDLVALVISTETDYPAYCRIPAAGHESDEVTFTALEPANLTAADRLALCSESFVPVMTRRSTPTPEWTNPDLRGATLLGSESANQMTTELLRLGTTTYQCDLFPQPWDFGGVHVTVLSDTAALVVTLSGSGAGSSAKSTVPGPATYYYGAGRLPSNARLIEFTISDKVVHTVTVGADGWWVADWVVEGRNSLGEPGTWTIKDATGTVVRWGSI